MPIGITTSNVGLMYVRIHADCFVSVSQSLIVKSQTAVGMRAPDMGHHILRIQLDDFTEIRACVSVLCHVQIYSPSVHIPARVKWVKANIPRKAVDGIRIEPCAPG